MELPFIKWISTPVFPGLSSLDFRLTDIYDQTKS